MAEIAPPHERTYDRFCAPLFVHDEETHGFEPFTTRNIGMGGLFLVSRRRPEVGSVMRLRLVHGSYETTFRARVTHLQADGFGVAFLHPTESLLDVVRGIIAELLSGGAVCDDSHMQARRQMASQVVWSQSAGRHDGRLGNVSQTGAFIECSDGPEPGTEVVLYLPGYTHSHGLDVPTEALGCRGRVAHRVASGFGVAFIAPSSEFRMALARLVRAAGRPTER